MTGLKHGRQRKCWNTRNNRRFTGLTVLITISLFNLTTRHDGFPHSRAFMVLYYVA